MIRRTMAVLIMAGAGLMVAGCAGARSVDTSSGSAAGGSVRASVSPAHAEATTSAPAAAAAGASASPPSSPGQLWLQSLHMTSAIAGWALYSPDNPADPTASSTLVASTSDGARTWTDVTPAAARPMLSTLFASEAIDPVDGQHAYLAVAAATQDDESTAPAPAAVFATADGGRTWTESAPFTVDGIVAQVTFADPEHGWLLVNVDMSPTGKPLPWLYRTTDGGLHWVSAAAAAPPGTGDPNDMCQTLSLSFPTATTGWLRTSCRSGNYVFVSHDGGSTWAPQPLPVSVTVGQGGPPDVTGPQFRSGTGFLTIGPALGDPSLLKTQDLGQTWYTLTLPAGVEQYPQVSFFSPTQGVLIPAAPQGVLGTVFYTTDDGGQNWTPVPQGTDFTQAGSSVDFTSTQTGFAWTQAGDTQSATPPPVYATTNSGSTWTPFIPVLDS
jgi:photosystem II stability/assembly factor-like uncharacterized protein